MTLRDNGGLSEDDKDLQQAHTEEWPALDFLEIACSGDHDGPCRFSIRNATVSVVVCGHDHTRWVAWGLSNTPCDPPTYEEECELREDFFATDGNGPEAGLVVDSDSPQWDPRRYWLRIIEIRVQIALKEWSNLVYGIEDSVRAWVSRDLAPWCLSCLQPEENQASNQRLH